MSCQRFGMESLSLIILEAAVCMQVLHLLTRWTLSWEVTVGLQLVWTLDVEIVQDEVGSTGSWQHVGLQKQVADDEPLEGHVTTDSSDSSDEENRISPVVGHYTVDIPEDKRLLLNQNSKMFHLSIVDHSRILLCGRRVSQSFKQHEGQVRYDSAKCRQCFRLKDS